MLSSISLLPWPVERGGGESWLFWPRASGWRGRVTTNPPLSPCSHHPAPQLWGRGGSSGGTMVGSPASGCERGNETGLSRRQDSPGDAQDQVIPVFTHLCPALGTGTGLSCAPHEPWRSSQPGVREVYAAFLRPSLAGSVAWLLPLGPGRPPGRGSEPGPKGLLGAGGWPGPGRNTCLGSGKLLEEME